MNIIDAIYHLVNHTVTDVLTEYIGSNRANNAGAALEEYVKDLFADTFNADKSERMLKLSEVFSYLGNNSNPPDAMLAFGDAIEIKKIESNNSAIALNSSYPKQKLFNSPDAMISKACREAENWQEKDMIYVVGVVEKNQLKHLSMVYGSEYCADEKCYSRLRKTIKEGVSSIPGVEFTESKELGHINRVDPLGITYMRVRGMWGIENPWKVFDYIYQRDFNKSFNFMCLMSQNKWESFDNTDLITTIKKDGFFIKNVKVKNPDNPAKLVDAKLIQYSVV